MGYYTTYCLTASDQEVLDKEMLTLQEGEEVFAFLSRSKDGSYHGNCKGYEHEYEVAQLSARHPTVLFTLDGHGEEQGDTWKKYFLNGKVHSAGMCFESFDSGKLREPNII